MCRNFFDVRTFGAVMSTGINCGQVRGPVQLTFARSINSVIAQEHSITRMAVATEAEAEKQEGDNRTMGRKHIVPNGLYMAHGFVSSFLAKQTGFSNDDLNLVWQALGQMFEHDRSAARGEMVVRGLYSFEHCGTQHPNNAEQNKREARLGCAHAHKLIEGIHVDLSDKAKADGKMFPESFADYQVRCEWTEANLPRGIKLHLRHEGSSIGPKQG